jgi:hypothetical protein
MNPDHQFSRQPHKTNSKTRITFVAGPKVYDHQLEQSDIHRAIRLDGQQVLFFSEVEYQLFMLLVEYHTKEHKEVSYEEIASRIFGCHIDEDLLLQLRKRMSAIRKKISPFDIDIISIPHRGYELRSLHDLTLPYGTFPELLLIVEHKSCSLSNN